MAQVVVSDGATVLAQAERAVLDWILGQPRFNAYQVERPGRYPPAPGHPPVLRVYLIIDSVIVGVDLDDHQLAGAGAHLAEYVVRRLDDAVSDGMRNQGSFRRLPDDT